MERNEDFNFKQIPGQELKIIAKNSGEPLISIATGYYNCKDYIMQTKGRRRGNHSSLASKYFLRHY